MMQSGLHYFASSGLTSGSGLAMAKMTGSLFKLLQMSSVKIFGEETPIRTSAPTQISARVVSYEMVVLARVSLNLFMPNFLPG